MFSSFLLTFISASSASSALKLYRSETSRFAVSVNPPDQWIQTIQTTDDASLLFPLVSSSLLPPSDSASPSLPSGNTLCKSGSTAVFGNVVYSGLLNDHLWHLGVPLFTRLVSPAPPGPTYRHFDFRSPLALRGSAGGGTRNGRRLEASHKTGGASEE